MIDDEAPPPKSGGSVAAGFGLGLLLQLLQIPLNLLLPMMPVLYIGLSQLVYLIPAVIWARNHGRPNLAKGLIIAGSIVALLNVACFGILFVGGLPR